MLEMNNLDIRFNKIYTYNFYSKNYILPVKKREQQTALKNM